MIKYHDINIATLEVNIGSRNIGLDVKGFWVDK
jgi:hypothetical protein